MGPQALTHRLLLLSSQDMTWLLLKNNAYSVEERVKVKIMAFMSVPQLRTLRKIDVPTGRKTRNPPTVLHPVSSVNGPCK